MGRTRANTIQTLERTGKTKMPEVPMSTESLPSRYRFTTNQYRMRAKSLPI